MILTHRDYELLAENFPDLRHAPAAQKIVGELSFCAAYDQDVGMLRIERSGRDAAVRALPGFISDVFEVEIRLDAEFTSANGWPEVLEVGGRHRAIAERYGVAPVDLHFSPMARAVWALDYRGSGISTWSGFCTNWSSRFFTVWLTPTSLASLLPATTCGVSTHTEGQAMTNIAARWPNTVEGIQAATPPAPAAVTASTSCAAWTKSKPRLPRHRLLPNAERRDPTTVFSS